MTEILSETNRFLSKIEQVLDEKIRPELSLHGGNIRVEKLEQGVLYVRMTGQCSGCPSAELTLENLVNVELATGVSDELISAAREMLQRRHAQS